MGKKMGNKKIKQSHWYSQQHNYTFSLNVNYLDEVLKASYCQSSEISPE